MEKPIDRLIPFIAQAVNEWMEEHSPETIGIKVKNLLDQNNEQVVMQLLGFEQSSYDKRWKIDRRGVLDRNTSVGRHLHETQQDAIKAWLSKVTLPDLKPAALKRIEKEFLDSYEEALSRSARSLAQDRASEDVEALVQSLVCSDRIEAFIKTMKLVEPQN